MTSRSGLNKFDTPSLSNDGGKYSPSIRRLRQHYFHDSKSLPGKIFSSTTHLTSPSLKCDDCQKHDGLFQCSHCNQRLCIRCCNKHYKAVTNELEYLNELGDRLLTKIYYIENDLEKQKNATIEQCHQWRIDTINEINKAHTLIIQTIQNEHEILGKEYQAFVDKGMSMINIDKNELFKMKKRTSGSVCSSPTSPTTKDSITSIKMIKERIETFTEHINERGRFSFQVKLPIFDLDDTLRVESSCDGSTRSTSVMRQNVELIDHTPSTEWKDPGSPSNQRDVELSSDHCDSTYITAWLSSINKHKPPISRRHTHIFHQTAPFNEDEKACRTVQSQLNSSAEYQENVGILRRHRTSLPTCGIRRQTITSPIRLSSSRIDEGLSEDYSWLDYRAKSIPPFLQ